MVQWVIDDVDPIFEWSWNPIRKTQTQGIIAEKAADKAKELNRISLLMDLLSESREDHKHIGTDNRKNSADHQDWFF